MKYCPSCKLKKDESQFHRNRAQFDGLNGHCKACRSREHKEYRKVNKASLHAKAKEAWANDTHGYRTRSKEWHASHKEEEAAYKADYYKKNKDRLSAQAKTLYAKDKEGRRAQAKKWYKDHEEEARATNRVYRENHRMERTMSSREYYYERGGKEKLRWQHMRKKFGITKKGFEGMLSGQKNRCAICRKDFDRTPNVDHDHSSGQIRGLLCGGCNRGLGNFKDDITRLRSAANYLQKFQKAA